MNAGALMDSLIKGRSATDLGQLTPLVVEEAKDNDRSHTR
jgi:hypothetical protein